MKKIFIYLLLSITAVSCYEDYVKDFAYTSVYFPFQMDIRTFVVGEGMQIKYGVQLGGVIENKIERVVQYTIDNSLLTSAMLLKMQSSPLPYIKSAMSTVAALRLLPANYYTVSDAGKIIIKPGYHHGMVTMKADSARFLADASTLIPNYVLPLVITSTSDADTVLKSKNYNVIGFKYENMLFGNYLHGGVTLEKNAAGTTVNTFNYFTAINQPLATAWTLTTVAPFELTANGYSNISSSPNAEMKLTVSGSNITISSVAGAKYVIQSDGTSAFNQAKLLQDRKLFLKYKYVNAAGNTCYATDTLTFRNRIRDGVNEWQDENPSHYLK